MLAVLAGLRNQFIDVERIMVQTLASDEARVSELIAELGSFHGKMLRPALVLLTAEAIGTPNEQHLRLSAALELIHTATLIHDDLIDDADTRRGKPTAHIRFGNTTSVLLGDYLYTHAFDLVAQLGDAVIMRQMTRTTNVICAGELHQQMAAGDTALSENEYNRIIHAKTAALCELAGASGAIAGSDSQRQAASEYGRLCGMAFQVVDDCFDFSGDPRKVGKTLTTDVERGRMTLPVLRWLALATDAVDRSAREQRILNAREPQAIAAIRAEIAVTGVPSALETARDYVRAAQAQLAAFPSGSGRDKLHGLAEFIVARDY